MKKTIKCDVLIMGAGPAGLTAALYCARAGLKTAVVENLIAGGAINLTPEIENFPGFEKVGGSELGEKIHAQAVCAGAEFIFDEITSIDFKDKKAAAETADLKFKALIIATGASPRKLGVSGEEEFWGAGVHTCGLCDGVFYKGKDIAVVGGGNSAVEEAIYLAAIANSVTIVNNTPKFNAQSVLVEKLETLKNIKGIFHSATVDRINGSGNTADKGKNDGGGMDDAKLTSITITENGRTRTINCDGVFLSIGRQPNTDLFKNDLTLSNGGYIIINEKMQTNIAGVFAAGDVCEKPVRQIITACADGAVAATSAFAYLNN